MYEIQSSNRLDSISCKDSNDLKKKLELLEEREGVKVVLDDMARFNLDQNCRVAFRFGNTSIVITRNQSSKKSEKTKSKKKKVK